jgi:hypothetical protein
MLRDVVVMPEMDDLDALLSDVALERGLGGVLRQQLIDMIEMVGNVEDACAEVGITQAKLQDELEMDPTFHDCLELAIGRFRSRARRRVTELALHGYTVPVIGGKDRDIVVAEQTIPDPKALQILAQMHFNKDMAQYTKAHVIEERRSDAHAPPKFDSAKLSREERAQLDALLHKAKVEAPALIEGDKEDKETE